MLAVQDVIPKLYAFWVIYAPYLVVLLLCRFSYGVLTRIYKKSVKDQVILITGASSGIGEALAKEFYLKGAKLILTSRRISELTRVKNEIVALNTSGLTLTEPKIHVMDMSDLESIKGKANEACAMFGRIDVLVHNAGILSRAEVAQSDLSVFMDVMQVNYLGVVTLTLAILPKMIINKRGHIVAISSVQGRMAIPRRSAYAASKHAVVAFMDSLRAEVAEEGIVVTCIHPGYVKTNIAQMSLTGRGDSYSKNDPNIESGYKVEYVAKKICDAVETNQPDVVISPIIPHFLIILRTLCPSLYFFIMKRIAKSSNYY